MNRLWLIGGVLVLAIAAAIGWLNAGNDARLEAALVLADVATPGARVHTRIEGSFGLVLADDATALALVLTELVTNAVEHGFAGRDAGTVQIEVSREGESLRVVVAEDAG